MSRLWPVFLFGAMLIAVSAAPVSAQSSIAGQVKDTSGGVLPGVTVEVSSPALIEQTRSAVTDSQGQYNVIDLRPGTYSVVFTLTGFRTLRREGIEVQANTVVPISIELAVGTLEETITVSGASPVVDTRSAQRTAVLGKDVIDALPTSRAVSSIGAVIPGVRLSKPDLGGTQSMQQIYGAVHGASSNQNSYEVDGMDIRPNADTASYQQYVNPAMTQEMSYQLSAVGAATEGGGLRINVIPRDGGNVYAGEVYFTGAPGSWVSNNLTPELIAKGLETPDSIKNMWDLNPAFGGPIVRDRLWFMASGRNNVVNEAPAGSFYLDGRPGIEDQYVNNASLRLTGQVTPKNKLVAYYDRAWKFKGHDMSDSVLGGGGTAGGIEVETAAGRREPKLYLYGQAKWTSTVTSRILFEAGLSVPTYARVTGSQPGNHIPDKRGLPEWYAKALRFDFIKGTQKVAAGGTSGSVENAMVPTIAMSYVTGSHNIKAGYSWKFGPRYSTNDRNADLIQRYRDGAPDSVTVYTTPTSQKQYLNADTGIYIQDGWTVKRLTLNPGLRWNYVNASVLENAITPGRFAPFRSTGRIDNLPNWKDWTPRMAAAFDLFGDGRTAIKGSASKFMNIVTIQYASRYNPMTAANENRNWNDCAFLPDTSTCNPALVGDPGWHDDIAQDNEIGPSNNARFGLAAVRRPDDDLRRSYTWEYSTAIQHQVVPGFSLTGAWYRRNSPLQERQRNLLVSQSDYAAFQVPNPLASQAGETITVFNLNRAKQGQVDIVDSNSEINRATYNAYELSFNGRLPHGVTVFGGWTTERTISITCETENPNNLRFCDESGKTYQEYGKTPAKPFRGEYKLNGSYEAPYGVLVGASFISYPGDEQTITYSVPANLFPGGRTETVTVKLEPAGTHFLKRWQQFDVSAKKSLRFGRRSLQLGFNVYNLLNSSVVLGEQLQFGTTLGAPSVTMIGRLFKADARFRF